MLCRSFYGPGGPYALFSGKDASRALAKMSFEEKDLTGDIEGLGPFELDTLHDWEFKFMTKYAKVGTIKKTVTEPESSSADVDAATDITERSADAEPSTEIPPVDAKIIKEDDAEYRDHDAKPKEDDAKPQEHASISHELQG